MILESSNFVIFRLTIPSSCAKHATFIGQSLDLEKNYFEKIMAYLVKVFCVNSYQYKKLLKNTLEYWNSYAGVSFYPIAFIDFTARKLHCKV